jgi:hypothetical protein
MIASGFVGVSWLVSTDCHKMLGFLANTGADQTRQTTRQHQRLMKIINEKKCLSRTHPNNEMAAGNRTLSDSGAQNS